MESESSDSSDEVESVHVFLRCCKFSYRGFMSSVSLVESKESYKFCIAAFKCIFIISEVDDRVDKCELCCSLLFRSCNVQVGQ